MTSHSAEPAAATVDHVRDLDQILLGLAGGSYVLSTPEGAVAEAGMGVAALLGTSAEALAGRPTADALVPGTDAQTREAFEELLRARDAEPRAFPAVTAAGEQRSLRFLVLAVPLTLGWEFTSLLSELGSRDPVSWRPEALRPRHGRALEAIEAACRGGVQPDAGARLAGILIVVRDEEAAPPTREDVGRRMTERRSAARATEAARRAAAAGAQLGAYPGDSGGQAGGLTDLVERARVLRERVEEAEHEAAAAAAERQQALAKLAAAQAEHAAELERREEGDGRAGRLAAERDEALAKLAAARAEHAAELERREEGDGRAGRLAAERDEALAKLAAARAEHAAELERREEVDGRAARLAAERDETLARAEAAEEETTELRAALSAAQAGATAMRQELDAALAERAAAQSELEDSRAELASTRDELASTLAAARGVLAEREQARIRASELLREAAAARAAAEAIRAEFAFDEPLGETTAAGPSPAAHAGAPQPATDQRPQLPPSAPGEAVALIGLDGGFKRLDDAFCSLLGYREEQLRAARWPSVIDRENFAAHAELARALRAGEIESAPVETVYMHAQGLLVPLAGTVSLHRTGDDDATFFVFRADVSRTAGAPS